MEFLIGIAVVTFQDFFFNLESLTRSLDQPRAFGSVPLIGQLNGRFDNTYNKRVGFSAYICDHQLLQRSSFLRSPYGPTRNVSCRCDEVCRPKAKSWTPSQWKPKANRFCYYKETCLQFGIRWLFGFKILLQYDRGCFCCQIVVPLDMMETWNTKWTPQYKGPSKETPESEARWYLDGPQLWWKRLREDCTPQMNLCLEASACLSIIPILETESHFLLSWFA